MTKTARKSQLPGDYELINYSSSAEHWAEAVIVSALNSRGQYDTPNQTGVKTGLSLCLFYNNGFTFVYIHV